MTRTTNWKLMETLGICLAVPLAVIAFRPPPPSLPAAHVQSAQASTTPAPPWAAFFSPRGGCQDAVTHEIGKAKKSIRVQAYSFTSQPIADALIAAVSRGVDVQVIVDKGGNAPDNNYSQAGRVAEDAKVFVDGAHAIAHNKVMIIDEKTVLTGSFNFTSSAEERNAENLLVIQDKELAAVYLRNWQKHCAHSKPWK